MITAASEFRPDDWASLVGSVAQGRCILMLGPDAVTVDLDGERVPVLRALARHLKRELNCTHGSRYDDLPDAPLSAVAQAVSVAEDPNILRSWVARFYDATALDDPTLERLARLRFPLVVNTAPGVRVEQAFRDVQVDFYDRTGPSRRTLPDPGKVRPLVYHLYGTLDQPDSLILSDNEHLDFLVSVISENPPLPPKFKTLLGDPERTFLFLGFRLHQWQLRLLVHVLSQGARRRFKSFALELADGALDEGTRQFYKEGHKINFFDFDVGSFVSELSNRVGPQELIDAGKATIAPDAPAVFICHASEDAARAASLADDLKRNGIRVWLDQESLRGGDRWDREIERVIGAEVAYVVVLQSAALKRKVEGYVNKEILLARERQRTFRAPIRFLVPVVIDDLENRLHDLDGLQSVDLTAADGVDRLVDDIQRDIERRQKAAR